ncbi:uncharacterized protein LOC141695762 [Apium graveolens]|uniref:uncharacterized protein LOC141695762 n=1 Tax=Apium graveolens TaxID=4045 RepID=UPI003D7B57C1
MTYFKCGKVGHMARNCKEPVHKANVLRITGPPPPPAQTFQPRARTFNIIRKDAVQNANMVAGSLAINSVKVKVLMDFGATKSFISGSVIDRIKCNLIIEVANQERVTVDRICPNCDIVIEGQHFSADLIPFKLGEFYIILGIDWLANHDAQIECRNKKVKLRTKNGAEVIFKGKRQDNNFLTIIQTRRLLRQGCEAYLAHVKDVEKESFNIEDIPVVKEFPDIFPDELPELPPDREIEFTVDLAPGAELDPSSGSDADSLDSLLPGSPVDSIPPPSVEPLYISSDPEEDPSESSEAPMHVSPLRPVPETPAPEREPVVPMPAHVGVNLDQD